MPIERIHLRIDGPGTACLIGQFGLSLLLGSLAATADGELRLYAAVGMAFALVLAHVLAMGALFLAALVTGAFALPSLLNTAAKALKERRFIVSSDPAQAARNARDERIALAAATVVHTLVLLAASLVLAAVIAALGPAGFGSLWWRFLLAALVLAIPTRRGLQAFMP